MLQTAERWRIIRRSPAVSKMSYIIHGLSANVLAAARNQQVTSDFLAGFVRELNRVIAGATRTIVIVPHRRVRDHSVYT
jgi:hypothetical protein